MGTFTGGLERPVGSITRPKQVQQTISENEAPQYFADETLSYRPFQIHRNKHGLPGDVDGSTPDQFWTVDGLGIYGDHVCSSSGIREHVIKKIRDKVEAIARPPEREVQIVTLDFRYVEGNIPDLQSLRYELRAAQLRTHSGKPLRAVLVRSDRGVTTLYSDLPSFPESALKQGASR